jgi:hypothetical protein
MTTGRIGPLEKYCRINPSMGAASTQEIDSLQQKG